MRAVLLMICVVLLMGCSSKPCRDSVEPASVDLEVKRLEQNLFSSTSREEVVSFLEANAEFSEYFLHADQYPSASVLADRIFGLIQNPSIDTLYQESLAAFEDFDETVREIEEGLGRLVVYYPETKIPQLQTAVTGLYNDLFITNNHIMIGMDFFIGLDATYKPQQIPDYILRRYTVEHLPANILQFVSSQYIQQSTGETMLTEMIDYGKSYYLLGKLLPCTPENILIGYTEEEWKDSQDNDAIIWANFVQNELLYETNHTVKQRFLGERPNVYEIGDKCPGRIGRWLGWQVVKSYAEKNGVSVQELMSETDANKIFTQSGYKPQGG